MGGQFFTVFTINCSRNKVVIASGDFYSINIHPFLCWWERWSGLRLSCWTWWGMVKNPSKYQKCQNWYFYSSFCFIFAFLSASFIFMAKSAACGRSSYLVMNCKGYGGVRKMAENMSHNVHNACFKGFPWFGLFLIHFQYRHTGLIGTLFSMFLIFTSTFLIKS